MGKPPASSGLGSSGVAAGSSDNNQVYSQEFGAYFVAILALTCGLFYTLQRTKLNFLRDFAGGWLEQVSISLVPSIVAILAVAIGGMRYVQLEEERWVREATSEKEKRGLQITTITIGDSCYYMGFLLTLWGLFLELLNLGDSLGEIANGRIDNNLIGKLIAGNGLALLSTIIGLVSRFIIHRFSPERMGEQDATDRLLTAFNKYADKSGGGGGSSFARYIPPPPPPPPPAPPTIMIKTHAISADVDARRGEVHIGDRRDIDMLYQRIKNLETTIQSRPAWTYVASICMTPCRLARYCNTN